MIYFVIFSKEDGKSGAIVREGVPRDERPGVLLRAARREHPRYDIEEV